MRRISACFTGISLFLLSFSASNAQSFTESDKMINEMQEIRRTWDKSDKLEEWVKAAEDLEKLALKYRGEWLPDFWASYFYTQMARSANQDKTGKASISGILDKAQSAFDKAVKTRASFSSRDSSHFSILQALIYAFKGGAATSETDKAVYNDKEAEMIKKAILQDPSNPQFKVYVATELAQQTPYSFRLYLGALALLKEAEPLLNAVSNDKVMATPYFTKQWLGFWLPNVQKGLKSLASKKEGEK